MPNGTPPPDLSDKQLSFVPGVLFDNHPIGNSSKFCQDSESVQFMLFHFIGHSFGDCLLQPPNIVYPGEIVTVR